MCELINQVPPPLLTAHAITLLFHFGCLCVSLVPSSSHSIFFIFNSSLRILSAASSALICLMSRFLFATFIAFRAACVLCPRSLFFFATLKRLIQFQGNSLTMTTVRWLLVICCLPRIRKTTWSTERKHNALFLILLDGFFSFSALRFLRLSQFGRKKSHSKRLRGKRRVLEHVRLFVDKQITCCHPKSTRKRLVRFAQHVHDSRAVCLLVPSSISAVRILNGSGKARMCAVALKKPKYMRK